MISMPDARGALRFSLGWPSTGDDVAALLAALPGAVDRARAAGLAGGSRGAGSRTADATGTRSTAGVV